MKQDLIVKSNRVRTTILFLILSFLLSACSSLASKNMSLKFAVLPILDSLPLYVAQQEGLFEKHNLNVELVPISSGPERDQLAAAGQIDGMINEVLTTIMSNRDNENLLVVRYARAATSEAPLFSIVASEKSGIIKPEELKGVEIAISEGTVIAYVTERILQAEGFTIDEIATVAVPKIPDRVSLISSGELNAGTLPEPVSSLLAMQGASVVISDQVCPEISHSAVTFRKSYVNENPKAVKAFLAAIEEAVLLINEDPQRWEGIMLDHNILPPALKGKFTIPPFVTAGVPSEQQFEDVLAWAKEKQLISVDVAYAKCVSDEFLPDKP